MNKTGMPMEKWTESSTSLRGLLEFANFELMKTIADIGSVDDTENL